MQKTDRGGWRAEEVEENWQNYTGVYFNFVGNMRHTV